MSERTNPLIFDLVVWVLIVAIVIIIVLGLIVIIAGLFKALWWLF